MLYTIKKTEYQRPKITGKVEALILDCNRKLGRAAIRTQLEDRVRNMRRAARAPNTPTLQLVRYVAPFSAYEAPIAPEMHGGNKSKALQAALQKIRTWIKEDRATRKELRTENQYRQSYSYQLIGGVFANPGSILDLLKQKKSRKVFESKKPVSQERHVGIELEFCSPVDQKTLGVLFADAGLSDHVALKSDGSLRPNDGDHAHELCILAKETEYQKIVTHVTELLSSVHTYVNASCGMHVHIDIRSRAKETVFNNLVAAQTILYSMVPSTRKKNTFCKPTRGREFKMPRTRYRGISALSYRQHRTIEIRLHSGTVNAAKINNWIGTLLQIADAPLIDGAVRSLKSLALKIGMHPSLQSYAAERIAKFKGEATCETDELPDVEATAPHDDDDDERNEEYDQAS